MCTFRSEISRIGMYAFLSGFFLICHKSMKKEIFIMRKEQITVTNNAENKALEGKGMRKHIKPLLEQGRLAMTLPDRPNSKNKKYITIK